LNIAIGVLLHSRLLVREKSADKFILSINNNFKSRNLKIKIRPPQKKKDNNNDNSLVNSRLMRDRELQIDAAIVRIMKARRTLNHESLVGEVVSQLSPHFSTRPIWIKKRIQQMIDRDFLMRDPNAMNIYKYVT